MIQEYVQKTKDTVNELLEEMHTALPGKIVSVDSKSGTCTVLPIMKKKTSNGELVEYPQVSGVPMVLPQGAGQGACVSFPVTSGDGCLIIISEQSLDYWMYGRATDTDLRFDITNAICIPGLFQTVPSSFSEACKSESVIVESDSVRLTVSSSGVTVNGNLTVTGNVTCGGLSTTKGDVTSNGISLSSHTHKCAEPDSQSGKPE